MSLNNTKLIKRFFFSTVELQSKLDKSNKDNDALRQQLTETKKNENKYKQEAEQHQRQLNSVTNKLIAETGGLTDW